MADSTSTARVNVEVTGLDQLNALGQAFTRLRTTAQQSTRPTSAVPASTRRRLEDTRSRGQRMVEENAKRTADAITTTVKAPFDVLGAGITNVTGRLISFIGPMANLAVGATTVAGPAGAVGVIAAGAIVGVGLFKLAVTIKLLRTSFRWVQEGTEQQMKILARTRRTFPGIARDALGPAMEKVSVKMDLAVALFGQGAENLEQRLAQTFTEFRMRRGVRGDPNIFARYGITPQFVNYYEQNVLGGEKMGVTDWLEFFIRRREKLDAQLLASPEGSSAHQAVIRRRKQLFDDQVKLFGTNFADLVARANTDDIKQLRANLEKSASLATVPDADERTLNFQVSIRTLMFTFQQLRQGIAGDVQPKITELMDNLNNWMLDTKYGGKGMGREFRNLASALAIKAWEGIRDLMDQVDPPTVRGWIKSMNDWNPASTIRALEKVVPAVLVVAEIIGKLAVVAKFMLGGPKTKWKMIPKTPEDWLKLFGVKGEEQAAQIAGYAPEGGYGPGWIGRAARTGLGYGGGGGTDRYGGTTPAGYQPPALTPQQQASQRALARAPGGVAPRAGTPEFQQWTQTQEFQDWQKTSPEYKQWARTPGGGKVALGPTRALQRQRAGPMPTPQPVQAPPGPSGAGPASNIPVGGPGSSPTVAKARAKQSAMIRADPALYEKVLGVVMDEVGGGSDEAVTAKVETLFNRGYSREGKRGSAGAPFGLDPNYYRGSGTVIGRRKGGKQTTDAERAQFERALAAAEGGSMVSGGATGNWSGRPAKKGVRGEPGTGQPGGRGYVTYEASLPRQKKPEQFSIQHADVPRMEELIAKAAEEDPGLRTAQAAPGEAARPQIAQAGLGPPAPAPTPTPAPTPVAPGAPAPTPSGTQVTFRRGAEGAHVPVGRAEGRVGTEITGGARTLPISDDLRAILEHSAEKAGVHVEVSSGGQYSAAWAYKRMPKGSSYPSERHTLGSGKLGAADIKLYTIGPDGKRKYLKWNTPEGQRAFAIMSKESAALGATGQGAGLGYMGAETIHIGGANVGGRPGAPRTWGAEGKGNTWLTQSVKEGSQQFAKGPPGDYQQQQQIAKQPATGPGVGVQTAPTAQGKSSIVTDWSSQARLPTGGPQGEIKGMVIHRTEGTYGSRGPAGLASVLQTRGLSVQFFIDKEGRVFRMTPKGLTAHHALLSRTNPKARPTKLAMSLGYGQGQLTNANLIGVEVEVAKGAAYNEAQHLAIAGLVGEQSVEENFDPKTQVYGHGELTHRKDAREGMSAVSAIRAGQYDAEIARGQARARGQAVVVQAEQEAQEEEEGAREMISTAIQKQRRRREALTMPPGERPVAEEAAHAERETEAAKELLKTKEADNRRKALTDKPPKKADKAIKEGEKAGKAAADKFKEDIEDVKIPVKGLKEETKESEKKRDEKESEAQKEAA